jgi:hypothetical protein
MSDERMQLTLADMRKLVDDGKRVAHRLEYHARRSYDDMRGFNRDSIFHVEKKVDTPCPTV